MGVTRGVTRGVIRVGDRVQQEWVQAWVVVAGSRCSSWVQVQCRTAMDWGSCWMQPTAWLLTGC
jgi:hypothetical protein